MIKIEKIQLNNFKFFTDDSINNTFKPNKNGMLIYGENGSGKSSLFKAFDFLTKTDISEDEFNENINIFSSDDTYLEFDFSNDETLRIDEDHLSLDNQFPFIEKLSISKPIIEYKDLLKVSFLEENKTKNLYPFFAKILENYPIDDENTPLKSLRGQEYFDRYKSIIKDELFDDINVFLDRFNHNIKIVDITFDAFEKETFLEIEYFNEPIQKYNKFLNEARLSALAISVYFAIIKKQFGLLGSDTLKILVLDDLLISLDMNNRLSLIDILKEEFSDFQIFFFTHEKALFDLVNEKMNLQSYEIYVKQELDYEVPFVKNSNDLLTQAIYQKDTHNYGCSANLLRQCTEKLLCKYLPKELQLDRRCKIVSLNTLLDKAKNFEATKEDKDQDLVDIFDKLKTFKRVLLNEASHYNSSEIYKRELEDVITTIESLQNKLVV